MNKLLKDTLEEEKEKCTGLVFKYIENNYFDRNKKELVINSKISIRKKLSCKCPTCDWILRDNLSEMISNSENWRPQGYKYLEPNKLYKLRMCDMSYDYYTGYIDEWDYKLIPYIKSTC